MSNLWIARDCNGDLWLFGRKPLRKKYVFMSEGWADKIANCLYPEVTWTNSPKELTTNQNSCMKFNIGDRIEIVRPFLGLGRNHLGAIGEIVDFARFPSNAPSPTHYVVKFECYKIPHYFMPCEIDESCEILNRKI